VIFQLCEEILGIVRRVVVDDIGWVVCVDLVNVFSEFGAGASFNFLDLGEPTALHEGLLGFEVLGKHLRELATDELQDVVGGQLEERLQRGQVGAHLDDVLQGFLCLLLQIARTLREHVDSQESGGYISFSEELGMIGGVSSNLSKTPGSSSLQVVLWFVDQSLLQGSNALGDDDSHGEGVVKGRNVTERHDSWESRVALGLTDVVDGSCSSSRVHD
jgi:hypothetical protein